LLSSSCLVALILVNYAPVDGLLIPQDDKFRDELSVQAMINAISINAAIYFYVQTSEHRAEVDTENALARSEGLIDIMMPRSIAERLKAGEERIADRIEMLSVMFADLAGFTEAARNLAPEQVVEFLDGLVRACDALCQQYGADKIKTIGDSYMAAAGFDGRQAEGAVAIGRLALAMMEVISQQPPLGDRKLRLRAGIHCGPATAGVIGDIRFSYDVWGDAVNIASRMESHGEPGRIQVSEAFRNSLPTILCSRSAARPISKVRRDQDVLLVGPRESLPVQSPGQMAGAILVRLRSSLVAAPITRRRLPGAARAGFAWPSVWLRGPRRYPGRQPSWTGGSCHAVEAQSLTLTLSPF
jgi:adenylate cyclase